MWSGRGCGFGEVGEEVFGGAAWICRGVYRRKGTFGRVEAWGCVCTGEFDNPNKSSCVILLFHSIGCRMETL